MALHIISNLKNIISAEVITITFTENVQGITLITL